MQRFTVSALPVTPWKNGGGSTQEIACWPAGATLENFAWRVSIARIASSGPFSDFPGVDRIITLLDGDGVHLHGAGVDRRLDRPLEPFAFPGDVAIDCTLLGNASSDFNVMTRRERMAADVRILRAAATTPVASHGLLLAVRGSWLADEARLEAGQGVWWADEARTFTLTPLNEDAGLVAVNWHCRV